ncbi:MAG: histidine phosphatase family protein [Bdellovibrio sp.]|nr:histidine phosphatase family protein [Methylotenera sp.]
MCSARLKLFLCVLLACIFISACDDAAKNSFDKNLKIVIIRHGEKPADNANTSDNLSCKGQNRALQLPAVLLKKMGKPDFTYVPALKLDKNTAHSRMFQTVTPLAVKYDLIINSKYEANDYAAVAKSVQKKSGSVLMVWSHSEMPDLASALGVNHPPKWNGADFDSMWIVTYANGKTELTVEQEGLSPSETCGF